VTGPLTGLSVVELTSEATAWAAKLLADLGADVVVVEPPGGSPQRRYGPWLDDQPSTEGSLWWWHYNTAKRSVVLDLEDAADRARFVDLVAQTDILLEGEPVGRLEQHAVDYDDLRTVNPLLIHVSVTAYGRTTPSRYLASTDLTALAAGGPVWSCGYDDHSLPPVRGGGNQAFHTASHWAVQAGLVALFDRDATGVGQFIDVSMHAACNVTTEMAAYGWLATGAEVQRQTGRHAAPNRSMATQVRCADGRYVNTGVLPRSPRDFAALVAWLESLGLREEFPLTFLLEMGAALDVVDLGTVEEDAMLAEIMGAARDVARFLCERLDSYEVFVGYQSRGMAAGVVYSPDEAIADPHLRARGFLVEVAHPELGRRFAYPGVPYRFSHTPCAVPTRAPTLGEHQALLDGLSGGA
jgi:crotonobetainyl-CoA:carnitine CoA-transferase CaiB-like acyl-CoA transferase